MDYQEAFRILELEKTNDIKKIKRAYARILKIYHPEENQDKHLEINTAYEVAQYYANYIFQEENYNEQELEKKYNYKFDYTEQLKNNTEDNFFDNNYDNSEKDIFQLVLEDVSDEKGENWKENFYNFVSQKNRDFKIWKKMLDDFQELDKYSQDKILESFHILQFKDFNISPKEITGYLDEKITYYSSEFELEYFLTRIFNKKYKKNFEEISEELISKGILEEPRGIKKSLIKRKNELFSLARVLEILNIYEFEDRYTHIAFLLLMGFFGFACSIDIVTKLTNLSLDIGYLLGMLSLFLFEYYYSLKNKICYLTSYLAFSRARFFIFLIVILTAFLSKETFPLLSFIAIILKFIISYSFIKKRKKESLNEIIQVLEIINE